MSVRHALLASVCTAFLAASAAAGTAPASSSAVALAEQGYGLLAAGKPVEAISAYSEAIESRELPPEILANSLLNRGLAYQKSSKHADAVDDYTAALRIDALGAKLRATALYNRGLAYQQMKRPALAIEDFTSALLLDTGFAHAYYSRGNALRDSGQLLFALSDYERALRHDHPQPQVVLYSEALAYEALNRPGEVQASLLKALAAKPDYQPARMKLRQMGLPVPALAAPIADEPAATGSTSKPQVGEVIAKTYLPAAIAPPRQLAIEAAPRRRKLFHDRVPEQEQLTRPRPGVEPAVETEAAASLPEEAQPADAPAMAAAATETSPAEEAAPPLKGWSIQLSSQRDEKVAWNVWSKMKARHKLLADQQPVVVKADLGTRGIFFRLRLAGFEDQAAAKEMCAKLKARGVSCFVSKASG